MSDLPGQPEPTTRSSAERRLAAWASAGELRAAVVIVIGLAAVGAALGPLWQWWSPPRPLGFVIGPGAVQPNETEAFIAADGRYAVIVAAVGLLAGASAWWLRSVRGPMTAVALAAGGLVGALLTELVGDLLGGGQGTGAVNSVITHLPLKVHMTGLVLVEPLVAVLVYGLFVSFAAADDLGRRQSDPRSVGAGPQLHDGGRNGDAPSAFQQPRLAPQ